MEIQLNFFLQIPSFVWADKFLKSLKALLEVIHMSGDWSTVLQIDFVIFIIKHLMLYEHNAEVKNN